MSRMRIAPTLLAVAALALPAAAQDAKRSEGRYFVELAEIMLNTEDFDILFAHDDHLGPRAGDPSSPLVAELPRNHLEAPKVTFGLNRPSGKSRFAVSFHDFDLKVDRIPQTFDREDYVTTSTLLPPGVVFQRQAQPSSRTNNNFDDDFIPNYGTDYAYLLQLESQVSDFLYERNAYENKRFRLRWLGGIAYGNLRQAFGHALAFAKEYGPDGSGKQEKQDFFFILSEVHTRGLGPKFGLDGRWLLDADKKWSIEARADVAYIPESTSASYQLNLVDASPEFFRFVITGSGGAGDREIIIGSGPEQPAIPGIPSEALRSYRRTFTVDLLQNDFTEPVYIATGRVGFRYQANKYFNIGLDVWQQRWMNVLSNAGMLETINDEGTFDFLLPVTGPGGGPNPDPQLQDAEAILNVPRFSKREDFVFDGINLNLSFQF